MPPRTLPRIRRYILAAVGVLAASGAALAGGAPTASAAAQVSGSQAATHTSCGGYAITVDTATAVFIHEGPSTASTVDGILYPRQSLHHCGKEPVQGGSYYANGARESPGRSSLSSAMMSW